jgi:hypothetical protein
VVSSLGLDGVRSVGEQEVLEVLGERFSSSGGERVRALHRHLVFDALRDDVARRHGLKVHLVRSETSPRRGPS